MGKKGHNWKGRQVVKTVIDDTSTNKIELDIKHISNEHYDSSNPLVLPSKKRKTKVKKAKEIVERILSKKQRKRLEKIVEKKNKKENRASLLEALKSVQISNDELNRLTSITTIQTKGLKRVTQENESGSILRIGGVKNSNRVGEKINSISGAKRKRFELVTAMDEKKKRIDDPNVIGVDDSDDDDDDDDDDDESKPKSKPETDPEPEVSKNEIVSKTEPDKQIVDIKPSECQKITEKPRVPTVYVAVQRSGEIEEVRKKLPIIGMEQEIMEAVNENDIVVIAGETGSGKTTQLPQFLYEAGYATRGIIGISEPRRVAAISMSRRVAEEMSEDFATGCVSYLIRYEGNATENTKIKFMTDGVLLREVRTDLLLTKYSVIILDEAHERSVYTDVLLGMLSRIVPLRRKKGNLLKLIVMSATLRLSDLTENSRLFKKAPPVVKVDARQFPVTIHFNRTTPEDYMKETFLKAVKIHSRLPDGGILVFVTGQAEVNWLVRRLRSTFPYNPLKKTPNKPKKKVEKLPEIDLDDYALPGCDDEDEIELSEDETADIEVVNLKCRQPLWVLPLYSLLSSEKQRRVFEAVPDGCRLCVVATNVAETSLTIPGVKYVIDTGKTKERLYDKVTGATSYLVRWTSKASANQRAGRAGRVAPGHCYRLYSSAVYNDEFCEYPVPEIQRRPADDLYLQMKCLNIDNVPNFPFPSAPDLLQLRTAENRLQVLGALDKSGTVTPLGRTIAQLPVLPQFGKMLALAQQHSLVNYIICIISGISVQELLIDSDEKSPLRQKWSGRGQQASLGDLMVLLRAIAGAEHANFRGKLGQFCEEYGLRMKAVIEARKLRLQLTQAVKSFGAEDAVVDPLMSPPGDTECRLLRQIVLAGSGARVAFRSEENSGKGKKALYLTADGMEEPVRLHKSCSLRSDPPQWIVYQDLFESSSRMFVRGVTAIEPEWLPLYCPNLCRLSEPLPDPPPKYENGRIMCAVTGTYGRRALILPVSIAEYPESVNAYRWFARFVLEGKTFPKLEAFRKHLLSTPETMLKSWAKLQPRTKLFLDALVREGVRSESRLKKLWTERPTYLLEEYRKWLPESAHAEVTLMWPPV